MYHDIIDKAGVSIESPGVTQSSSGFAGGSRKAAEIRGSSG
jgi:hypothetical protein